MKKREKVKVKKERKKKWKKGLKKSRGKNRIKNRRKKWIVINKKDKRTIFKVNLMIIDA